MFASRSLRPQQPLEGHPARPKSNGRAALSVGVALTLACSATSAGRATIASDSRSLGPRQPGALAVHGQVVYIADDARNQILARHRDGHFTVVAGTGRRGFSGDGGPAIRAELNAPAGMTTSADGTLYFADRRNNRIRAISPSGTIRTVAGSGASGWVERETGALSAAVGGPAAVAIGPRSQLYIAAQGANEVLRLTRSGRLVRVAGIRGPAGVYGIGRPAVRASADGPNALAFDRKGNLYIAGSNTKTALIIDTHGTMRVPAGDATLYPRGDGQMITSSTGHVLATSGTALVEITLAGIRQVLDLGRVAGLPGFVPNGLARGPGASLFADTSAGNGFARRSALIEFHLNRKVKTLWQRR